MLMKNNLIKSYRKCRLYTTIQFHMMELYISAIVIKIIFQKKKKKILTNLFCLQIAVFERILNIENKIKSNNLNKLMINLKNSKKD